MTISEIGKTVFFLQHKTFLILTCTYEISNVI